MLAWEDHTSAFLAFQLMWGSELFACIIKASTKGTFHSECEKTILTMYTLNTRDCCLNFESCFAVVFWETTIHPLPRNTSCPPRDQVALIPSPEGCTWQQQADLSKTFLSLFQDQERSAIKLKVMHQVSVSINYKHLQGATINFHRMGSYKCDINNYWNKN